MTAARQKKTSEATRPRCIYVIAGKDRRRVTDQLHRLTETLLGDADPQVALSSFDDSAGLADVLDELRTLPFLSPRRIVVVKDADAFIKDHRRHLEAYLEKPSETGVLVLVAESFPGNTRLAKAAAKLGEVITCDEIKPRDLPGFLTEYARDSYSLKLARQAAHLLAELGGDDAGMLMSEIDKLAAYLADPQHPASEITADDVLALVGNNRTYNVFNVIDAMTAGDTALALTRLDQMLRQDRDAQYTAVGAFAWHFRRLYRARIMLDQRVNERQITGQLRIWAHQDQFIRQARRLSVRAAAELLRELMRIDYDSKSGGATVQAGLERLIISFARPPGRVA